MPVLTMAKGGPVCALLHPDDPTRWVHVADFQQATASESRDMPSSRMWAQRAGELEVEGSSRGSADETSSRYADLNPDIISLWQTSKRQQDFGTMDKLWSYDSSIHPWVSGQTVGQ